MACCALELAVFFFGIISLTGEFPITRSKVVRGKPAFIVGILLIVPFPAAVGINLLIKSIVIAETGEPPGRDGNFIELGAFAVCLAAALVVALVAHKHPKDHACASPPNGASPPVPKTQLSRNRLARHLNVARSAANYTC
jgi:hypothetical protein